jgi:hypothetical protein
MKKTMKLCAGITFAGLLLSSGIARAEAEVVGQDLHLMSNQMFLEETLDDLKLSDIIKNKIPKKSNIVLRNIELDETSDRKMVALVEDQLIAQLVNSGYRVLERDENVIKRTLEERYSGGKFSLFKKDIKSSSGQSSEKMTVKAKKNQTEIVVDQMTSTKGDDYLVKTHLTGADYIISYRIQELGINYSDGDKNSVARSSIVRLHVRAENTRSGAIALASNIESKKTDMLSHDMVKTLKKYRYGQFYNGYPLANEKENTTYYYSNRRPFVELALMTAPAELDKELGPFSFRAIGIQAGKDRISIETTNYSKDEKFGTETQTLENKFTMLIFGREISSFDTQYGEFDTIVQVGLGNGNMNIKDGNKIESEEGLAFKGGIALETDLMWDFSAKIGAEAYVGDAGVLPSAFASIKYTFN